MDRKVQEKEIVKFLIISGFHPKKGHLNLIDAFAGMTHSTDRKVELHIVGDGPLREAIAKKIADTGLSNIHLHGSVTYGSETHKQYFRDADVFVHPSLVSADGDKEGIPGAIIEAMAAGLPVVSTFHAGIPYIIENNHTGLLVKEKDTMALKAAMTRMAEDFNFRTQIAENGQIHALENLDILKKEQELELIYDQIGKKKAKEFKHDKINDSVS